MFVTGRFPIVLALGALPIIILGVTSGAAWATLAAWLVIGVALLVIDVRSAASPTAIDVDLESSTQTRLGAQVTSRLRLINTGARTIRGTGRQGWQPTANASPARFPVTLPPRESRRIDVALTPSRRGTLRADFVVIRSLGPLGLAGRQRVIRETAQVRVLPPFASIRDLPSRVARLREFDGNTLLQVRGQGTEFDSLREYVRGDDVRSIDWRATARSGTLMLRTWRPERDRHVAIVIDTGRTAATRVGDSTRLDASIETALLVATLATSAGDHVHVIAFDRQVRARVSGVDGDALAPALMAALAGVDPHLIDTDWTEALAQVRRLTPRTNLLVLLTAHESPLASRNFLALLPGLSANGQRVIVATATDTGLMTAATSASDRDSVHLAASAEASMLSAAQVEHAITRAGAEAVVCEPDVLPSRVADRYIDLKRAGRL